MKPLPPNFTATTISVDDVPPVPISRRVCPGCHDTMRYCYAWKPSEHQITYMFVCHCGNRSKVRLLHFNLNSYGGLVL